MKKLIIFISIVCFAFALQAQTSPTSLKTVTTNLVATYFGAAGDTVIKNGTHSQTFYVKNWCENTKVRTTLVRSTGAYTKVRVIIQSSLDNVTYVAKDTVAFAGTGASIVGLSDLVNAKDPYVKILVKPYDSTQTVKLKHTILFEKD